MFNAGSRKRHKSNCDVSPKIKAAGATWASERACPLDQALIAFCECWREGQAAPRGVGGEDAEEATDPSPLGF